MARGQVGHRLVQPPPDPPGPVLLLKVGLGRGLLHPLPDPGGVLLLQAQDGQGLGGLFPGELQLFQGLLDQGLHPAGRGVQDPGGLLRGVLPGQHQVERGPVHPVELQHRPEGVGEEEGQGDAVPRVLLVLLIFLPAEGVFLVKLVAGLLHRPQEPLPAGEGLLPALVQVQGVLQGGAQQGQGLAHRPGVQVAQGKGVPGVFQVEFFHGTDGVGKSHRRSVLSKIDYFPWRGRLRWGRRRSSQMPLCSSHMATSAPKNRMYMQKNSQNMSITRVARPP